MYDGLQTLVQLFMAEAQAQPMVSSILQIVVVPVLFFGDILFVQRFFRPWVRRTMLESRRVAELLAQLPKEVSVEALVMEAMGRTVDPARADSTAAPPPPRADAVHPEPAGGVGSSNMIAPYIPDAAKKVTY